jgi:hypothetical protein
MKIYKNNSYVKLELDEFLDLLEEDALDEIIYMIMDLDASGSINGNSIDDYDEDYSDMDEEFITKIYYTDSIDIQELMSIFPDDVEYYSMEDNDEMLNQIIDFPGYIDGVIAGETMMDNLLLTNEDLQVRKIVKRFNHLLDD